MLSGTDVWNLLMEQIGGEAAEQADVALAEVTKPYIERFIMSLPAEDEEMPVNVETFASLRTRFITSLIENGYGQAVVDSLTDEVVAEFGMTRPEIVEWGNNEFAVDLIRNGMPVILQPYVDKALAQGLVTIKDVLLINPALIFAID